MAHIKCDLRDDIKTNLVGEFSCAVAFLRYLSVEIKRMKKIYIILLLHIILVLLASTNFTILALVRDVKSFSWNYYTYSYRNGFGYTFESDYSLQQVLTYIGAYATGLILFALVFVKGLRITDFLGFGVCSLGLVSFIIEGSHWISEHHLSWIASFPIALIVLWLVVIIASIFKLNKQSSIKGHAADDA